MSYVICFFFAYVFLENSHDVLRLKPTYISGFWCPSTEKLENRILKKEGWQVIPGSKKPSNLPFSITLPLKMPCPQAKPRMIFLINHKA